MMPKPFLRPGLLLLLLLWPTIGLEAQYQAISIRSPYKTPAKNIQMINTIVLKTLLFLNYTEHDGTGDIWKTRDIAGLESNRFLIQQLGGGAYRTLEIALAPFPEGGYDFYLYGRAGIAGGAFQPNPDLATVQSTLQQIISEIQIKRQSPTPQDLGHQVVHLSYVQTDRVLALLKAVGYTTIEFTQSVGETLYDKIFTPYQNGEWRPPVIIKFIDSAKTSLMEPSPTGAYQQGISTYSAVPDIGGTFLHHATSG
ncbi:MAG: hypothetical protein O7G87_01005, partial [bacterium]|nr:hypothetical protein [bacterium]